MAHKIVLGWLLNNIEHHTVQLTQSRVLQLNKILALLPTVKTCVSKKIWYQVLGEQLSIVLGILGVRVPFPAT